MVIMSGLERMMFIYKKKTKPQMNEMVGTVMLIMGNRFTV